MTFPISEYRKGSTISSRCSGVRNSLPQSEPSMLTSRGLGSALARSACRAATSSALSGTSLTYAMKAFSPDGPFCLPNTRSRPVRSAFLTKTSLRTL